MVSNAFFDFRALTKNDFADASLTCSLGSGSREKSIPFIVGVLS